VATVYTANVTGDGTSPSTAFRPTGFDGHPFSVLMLDPGVAKKCMVVSSQDTITGTGISALITRSTWPDLLDWARTHNPTTAQRNAMNTWLTGAGLATLTAAQVNWFDCIQYAAQQVNPAADLANTSVI
jgi:hypothetical protein